MAYIVPDGELQFFGDLGLSPSHDDTLYFPSQSAKDNYFSSLNKITTANALSYTRIGKGKLRIEKPMRTMITCAYMRFKNVSFENKWWYAFVTGVEYVNDITTEVTFEIDPIMCWMGEFELGECFVERQHTIGDNIGANICDEGLECGEYITSSIYKTGLFSEYDIGFLTTEIPAGADTGNMMGLFSGLYLENYLDPSVAFETLKTRVSEGKGDSIISVLMYPRYLSAHKDDTSPYSITLGGDSLPKPIDTDSFNGYVPRNHKLYTYPYMMLQVINSEGGESEYKYEYFNTLPDETSSGAVFFKLTGSIGGETEVRCEPLNYSGNGNDGHEYALNMKNFPECAWSSDIYKAYIAQNKSSIVTSLLSTAVSGAGSTAFATLSGTPELSTAYASVSANVNIQSKLAKLSDIKRLPPQAKGHYQPNLAVAMRDKDFYFKRKQITKNYAIMIDNYFTAFGYAIKQVMTPNMNARPLWTYVKTIGCNVHGNLSSSHAKAIEDAFDKGVRFWNVTNGIKPTIGDYGGDNSPRT